MLLYGHCKPHSIRKGGTPMAFSLTGPHLIFTTYILSEHMHLNSVNNMKLFLIIWKCISVYQALFLCAGYQAWGVASCCCFVSLTVSITYDILFILYFFNQTLQLLFEDGIYFTQNSRLCGYYLRAVTIYCGVHYSELGSLSR